MLRTRRRLNPNTSKELCLKDDNDDDCFTIEDDGNANIVHPHARPPSNFTPLTGLRWA